MIPETAKEILVKKRLAGANWTELAQFLQQEYGIDVGAASQKYATDVGWDKSKYVTDMQERMGVLGIKVNAAQILSSIEDNAEATSYIWNLIFGDNVSPGDWLDKWKKKWEAEG